MRSFTYTSCVSKLYKIILKVSLNVFFRCQFHILYILKMFYQVYMIHNFINFLQFWVFKFLYVNKIKKYALHEKAISQKCYIHIYITYWIIWYVCIIAQQLLLMMKDVSSHFPVIYATCYCRIYHLITNSDSKRR